MKCTDTNTTNTQDNSQMDSKLYGNQHHDEYTINTKLCSTTDQSKMFLEINAMLHELILPYSLLRMNEPLLKFKSKNICQNSTCNLCSISI